MWNEILIHFHSYVGYGAIFFIYIACLVFLLIFEKRKERRLLFTYLPLIILILFFMPFFAALYERFSDFATYFRILWLLPVTVTIADTLVEYVFGNMLETTKLSAKVRSFIGIIVLIILMISGGLIYTDEGYSVAENEYHMPKEVVDICDAVVMPGREVMVAFPKEMLVYVRQYSAMVCMPYGYDIEKYASYDEFAEMVSSYNVNAQVLTEMANAKACHYVVLRREAVIDGNMVDYNYEKFEEIGEYVIYKNLDADFSLVMRYDF